MVQYIHETPSVLRSQRSAVQMIKKGQKSSDSMLEQMKLTMLQIWMFFCCEPLIYKKENSGGTSPLRIVRTSFFLETTWKYQMASFYSRLLKTCLRMDSLCVYGGLREILTMQMRQRQQTEKGLKTHSQQVEQVKMVMQTRQTREKQRTSMWKMKRTSSSFRLIQAQMRLQVMSSRLNCLQVWVVVTQRDLNFSGYALLQERRVSLSSTKIWMVQRMLVGLLLLSSDYLLDFLLMTGSSMVEDRRACIFDYPTQPRRRGSSQVRFFLLLASMYGKTIIGHSSSRIIEGVDCFRISDCSQREGSLYWLRLFELYRSYCQGKYYFGTEKSKQINLCEKEAYNRAIVWLFYILNNQPNYNKNAIIDRLIEIGHRWGNKIGGASALQAVKPDASLQVVQPVQGHPQTDRPSSAGVVGCRAVQPESLGRSADGAVH